MHAKVMSYIEEINNNDPMLISIKLEKLDLSNADIEALMHQLANNPIVAQQIMEIHLGYNKLTEVNIAPQLTSLIFLDLRGNLLTAINIPIQLTALEWLHLEENPLTDATIFALKVENSTRRKITGADFAGLYSRKRRNTEGLCRATLTWHFNPMLPAIPGAAIDYFKSIGIMGFWQKLPPELIMNIAEYTFTIPEMTRVRSSLAYLQSVFDRLDDKKKLKTINEYNNNMEYLYCLVKKYFIATLVRCDKIASARHINKNASSPALLLLFNITQTEHLALSHGLTRQAIAAKFGS